ncbi:class I SAM-dependent methyltransferase [Amylibacter sp.]|jgi:SAM-dependent methyltransferase|nr:class I SAM-dependent methyltransferase [Amylibacter sp.]MDB9857300.1 class I SAM-dependent methyltransferase [Amylibacter sp.]
MNALTPFRPCPACDTPDVTNMAQFAHDTWKIGKCKLCDFVFLRNPTEYEALEEDFAWEETFWAEDAERKKKRGILKRAAYHARMLGYRLKGDPQNKYVKLLGAGKILDIGCGEVVRWTAPFEPYGIEISKHLHARADAKMKALGGECFQGAGAERIFTLPENHFDSVMMHSYLEHEVQYRELLAGCFRCLKPGGRAFIRVPNFNSLNRRLVGAKWPGFRYPDHVNYFTQQTLRTAAQEAGFEFKLTNKAKIWLDDNIQALLTKPAVT